MQFLRATSPKCASSAPSLCVTESQEGRSAQSGIPLAPGVTNSGVPRKGKCQTLYLFKVINYECRFLMALSPFPTPLRSSFLRAPLPAVLGGICGLGFCILELICCRVVSLINISSTRRAAFKALWSEGKKENLHWGKWRLDANLFYILAPFPLTIMTLFFFQGDKS